MQRLVVAVAVTLVVLAGNGTASAAEATRPGVTGIDVSHWQDAIDWPSVARSGVRFAIAKATEGQTFTDPRYAENKNGAESAGLAFTAYHFAQPDRAPGDAVSEADHFLDVADLSSGNLLPVLDIERTGGLTPRELVAWARTWLARVQARLGVRAVVYTNPAFWHTAMANSTWFARAGSPLWIAHYGRSAPHVPADSWAGRGWTYWQDTNCGAVRGIAGCVDVNRLSRAELTFVTMRSGPRLVGVA